jgi:uncharacterized protein (DUF362 family)/NAD-dependent dihydropyrimidine dehydrogenase PreA subunit
LLLSRVYVAICQSYDQETVEAALNESLKPFTAEKPLIKPGQKVVLKPNLLQARSPEGAVTTHPALVAEVARWVKRLGAMPVIADSPGGQFTAGVLRRLYRATGMAVVAEETGAVLNYDTVSTFLPCQEGSLMKMLDAAKVMADADAIISLPKLKTHGLTRFTGATKNLFGTVPGITKAAYHTKLPYLDSFSDMLIDVLCHYKPVLTIMDAVIGMEGDGPSGGDPKYAGLLLTSTDGIALDVVATSIIGMPPLSVPPIAAAARRGLTTGRVEDIDILGIALKALEVEDFRKPSTGSRDMRWVPRFLRSWLNAQLLASPVASTRCIACGVCVKNCPVQAITIVNDRAHMDLKECIRCYCCHELCPVNAVDLRQSYLGHLAGRYV